MIPRHIYLATHGTDRPGAERGAEDRLLVLAGLVVPGAEIAAMRERARVLLPASPPADDAGRRLLLQRLAEAGFRFVALVIDKAELEREPRHRDPVTISSHLHRLLHRRLYEAFPGARVVVDPGDARTLVAGFRDWVVEQQRSSLFPDALLKLASMAEDPLLQAAAEVASTLSLLVRGRVDPVEADLLRAFFRESASLVDEWPPAPQPTIPSFAPGKDHLDRQVLIQAVEQARRYIERHGESSDEDERLRAEAMKKLLYHLRYIDETEYISTFELMRHLQAFATSELSPTSLRAEVIGPLRDAGMLIASSAEGYKLPASRADMKVFVDRFHRQIGPMLVRLKRARDRLLLASNGEVDLLGDEEHAYLRRLCALEDPLAAVTPSEDDLDP